MKHGHFILTHKCSMKLTFLYRVINRIDNQENVELIEKANNGEEPMRKAILKDKAGLAKY